MQVFDQALGPAAPPGPCLNGVKGRPAQIKRATKPLLSGDETPESADRRKASAVPKRGWIAACLSRLLNGTIVSFAAYAQSAYPAGWPETAALSVDTRDGGVGNKRTSDDRAVTPRWRPSRYRSRRPLIGELTMLDDRMLRDIGVHQCRVEIISEGKTLWT